MRKSLLPVCFFVIALCVYAQAQLLSPIVNFGHRSVATFQGPGDIVSSATAFWSAGRAYNATFAASTASIADIVDTATGVAACTMKIATTGYADLTSVVCPTSAPAVNVVTFCTVTHATGCTVVKLYDQTGNGNHATRTYPNGGTLTFSALNGLPCLVNNGAAGTSLGTASITLAQPFSITTVGERTGNFTSNGRLIGQSGGSVTFGYRTSINLVGLNAGTALTQTASDSAFHAMSAVGNGVTNSVVVVDGSAATGNAGTTGFTGAIDILSDGASGLTGDFCEGGIWPSAFNSTQYGNLNTNMHSATVGWNF